MTDRKGRVCNEEGRNKESDRDQAIKRQMRSRDSSDTLRQCILSVSLGAAELKTHTHTHIYMHKRCDVVSCDFDSDWVFM